MEILSRGLKRDFEFHPETGDMAKREDGRKTKERLLAAACEIFADKGYQDARIADICGKAGANVASVNYHFGDKAGLYRAAWELAFERFTERLPPEPDGEGETPEARLRRRIRGLVLEFSRQEGGLLPRLYLRELVRPTGLADETWRRMIAPRRRWLMDLIRAVLGPEFSEETVTFCEMSVVNQCRVFLTMRRDDMEFLLGQPLTPDAVERLADHITRFSMAAILAIRDGAENGSGSSSRAKRPAAPAISSAAKRIPRGSRKPETGTDPSDPGRDGSRSRCPAGAARSSRRAGSSEKAFWVRTTMRAKRQPKVARSSRARAKR
jgi:TetR/AcrR family transcriptional regulator, regulator of cefoperazone and chloramphenicol sensitivity